MKKWVLMLGVSFLSFSSFGTDYELDYAFCTNFEKIEENYRKYPRTETELLYASCLLVKGIEGGDESFVKEGLNLLKDLAYVDVSSSGSSTLAEKLELLKDLVDEGNDLGNIVASFYYADFYYSEGTFGKRIAEKNLELVALYFTHTFEYIKNNPSYSKEYAQWEEASAIEMGVYSRLSTVYLQMYYLSIVGDFYYRLLKFENEDTFPEYRGNSDEYIKLAKTHAEECKDLPWKKHFRKTAELFKKVCAVEFKKVDLLIEIQGRREDALENVCGEDVSEEACPQIQKLNKEFSDMYSSIFSESDEILKEGEHLFYPASFE